MISDNAKTFHGAAEELSVHSTQIMETSDAQNSCSIEALSGISL